MSVFLKVVPVEGAAILQVTMDQLICASLFPHPLLVGSGHVDRSETIVFSVQLTTGRIGKHAGS